MRNSVSNIFGAIANIKFPKTIQNFINKKYIDIFEIDMSDFKDYDRYSSLNELFTRRLIRPRCIQNSTLISPSDGLILYTGKSSEDKALSIKNRSYTISELLGTKDLPELNYANIYLSPKDYHHYHAPADIKVLEARYFSANLYSVAPSALKRVANLYTKNERVVLKCELKNSKILWLVFVGAMNVGKMKFNFDDRIQTNAKHGDALHYYDDVFYRKGEHMGNFELGSTILMLSDGVEFNVGINQNVKFGDSFGKVLEI